VIHLFFSFLFLVHPIYISSTNVVINDDKLEIKVKLFRDDLEDGLKISKKINIEAIKENGQSIKFQGILRIDTEVEIEYIRYGGILQYVLANLLKQ